MNSLFPFLSVSFFVFVIAVLECLSVPLFLSSYSHFIFLSFSFLPSPKVSYFVLVISFLVSLPPSTNLPVIFSRYQGSQITGSSYIHLHHPHQSPFLAHYVVVLKHRQVTTHFFFITQFAKRKYTARSPPWK